MNGDRSPVGSPADRGLLEIRDLRVALGRPGRAVTLVDGLDLTVAPGQTVGLVGESGSGKSITARAVMGILPRGARVIGGDVLFDGVDLVRRPRKELDNVYGKEIAMIFQDPRRSLDPAFAIGEQIAEVARRHLGLGRKAAWKAAVEALDTVRIPKAAERARDYPHQCSGGMCQRVMLAIAIVCRPRLLIADEPTTALDVTTQAKILALLRTLQRETELGILLITHDLAVVSEMCDDVSIMYAGQVLERAVSTQLFAEPRHPYSEALIGACPSPGAAELTAIEGQVPSPGAWPPGCRYEPRCAHTDGALCARPQPMIPVDGGITRCRRATELTLEGIPS